MENTSQKDTFAQLPVEARWAALKREKAGRYEKFRKQYFNDPVGFAEDIVGVELADYQADVMAKLASTRRLSVRSLHGVGKTMISSVTILWFSLTRDTDYDWKVIATASNFRQIEKFLFPEMKRWSRQIDWEKVGRDPFDENKEMLKLSLNLETGAATGVSSTDAGGIEGVHAEQLLYIIDEAKIVGDDVFDAVEGALSNFIEGDSKEQGFVMCVSTPGGPSGRFYEIQAQKPAFTDWTIRHITLKEGVDAGRISPKWAEQRRIQWGERSAMYRSKVLGEFTESDTEGLVPVYWIELANERWEDREGNFGMNQCIGVDVSSRGRDASKMAYKCSAGISSVEDVDEVDTMALVNTVRAKSIATRSAIVVDSVGVGEGVYSRLQELGSPVLSFNGGEKALQTDMSGELEFKNMKTAGYWRLREMLNPDNHWNICLPPNDELLFELSTIQYEIDGNKIAIEPKKKFRKRNGGRSPDTADAVVYACALDLLEEEIVKKKELNPPSKMIKLKTPRTNFISVDRGRDGRANRSSGKRGFLI